MFHLISLLLLINMSYIYHIILYYDLHRVIRLLNHMSYNYCDCQLLSSLAPTNSELVFLNHRIVYTFIPISQKIIFNSTLTETDLLTSNQILMFYCSLKCRSLIIAALFSIMYLTLLYSLFILHII